MRLEHTSIVYTSRMSGAAAPLRCDFLESGLTVWRRSMRFTHASPGFNRIFLFRTGSCAVVMKHGEYRLQPGSIYLLPVNRTFAVTYAVNSELVFFHLAENVPVHGSTATKITIGYRETPAGLTLLFEDNGMGIPDEMKNQIFH